MSARRLSDAQRKENKQRADRAWRSANVARTAAYQVKYRKAHRGQRELIGPAKTHGLSYSSTYHIHRSMIARCTDPQHDAFKHYGARGIIVCQEWLDDFTAFIRDMGTRPPRMTLDRIDSDLGYCKHNCRWVSHQENSNNKRNNVRATAWGETKTISQWARDGRCVVKEDTLRRRLKLGITIEKALTVRARCLRVAA